MVEKIGEKIVGRVGLCRRRWEEYVKYGRGSQEEVV